MDEYVRHPVNAFNLIKEGRDVFLLVICELYVRHPANAFSLIKGGRDVFTCNL